VKLAVDFSFEFINAQDNEWFERLIHILLITHYSSPSIPNCYIKIYHWVIPQPQAILY